jgi:Zn finger protein HypA/HybF involved in hydrogenase expression
VHELSLAVEICRIAERAAGAGRARRVRAVAVEVGDEAGVEPANLAFCLEVLLRQPPFGGADARIARAPGTGLLVRHLEMDDDDPDD